MKKGFLILLFLLAFISNKAQDTTYVQDEPKNGKLKFIFNFDARRSFVGDTKVRYWGLKLGLGNRKHRFGIGFHGLQEPVLRIIERPEDTAATDSSFFDYGQTSFYYEPIFYQSKRWEFSAPVHLNFGNLRGSFRDTAGRMIPFIERGTLSLTFSFKGHFKVFRWIGLGFGAGYNQLLGGDKNARKALSQPFYSYGVKIFLGELWKLTFNKSYRKSEWIE